uniref:Peroxisomal membrane protein 2 n=1 Tax=Sphenodon punctatus TaxID=8508 RepID=A0A8D0GL60_SPHPU
MSPALSKLESEPLRPLPQRLLERYLLLLRLYPVLTKATSSAILSALGSLLSQIIERSRKRPGESKSFDLGGPLRFAIYGFLFTGPLSHYFYLYLEQLIPSTVPLAMLKRLLLDRLIVSPAFLLLFFFVMNVLEGKDLPSFAKRIKRGYWVALKMNWKVWTPFQFINFNYIPMQVSLWRLASVGMCSIQLPIYILVK